MVPVKALLAAAAPLPLNEDAVPPEAVRPSGLNRLVLDSALIPVVRSLVRLVCALVFFSATFRSTRWMVMMSPIWRARRSSNSGRRVCA